MKFWKLLVLLGVIASPASAMGAGKFGAGFILGEPTSISGKYYANDKNAYDLQISFLSRDYFVIYGDYLFHFPELINHTNAFNEHLNPYVGVGPVLAFHSRKERGKGQYFDDREDKFGLGVRVPFGMEWMWDKVPLGIGLEIAPGIMVLPSTTGVLMGGLTLRYYF